MNPDNSETETSDVISGYFDDALSAAECGELAVLLRNDPAAALEFAHTARIHTLLEAAAPARPAGRAVMLRRRWLSIGAAAALIAAGSFAAVQYFSRSPDASPAPHIVIEDVTGDFNIKRKPLPPGVNLRTVRAPAATSGVKLDRLLENFYVHVNPGRLTVPEALKNLERGIRQCNVLNRRELASLRFTAGRMIIPPFSAEGEPLPKLQFDKSPWPETTENYPLPLKSRTATLMDIVSPLPGPFTVKEYLDICGLYQEVRQEPGAVVYAAPVAVTHPLTPPRRDALQETRTFQPLISAHRYGNSFVPQDAIRFDLQNRYGISIGERATVSFEPGQTSFTIEASHPKLDRLGHVLDVCAQRKPFKHLLTTKYILCPVSMLPPGFDASAGMVLGDAGFQGFLRGLSQAPGVEMTHPLQISEEPGTSTRMQLLCAIPGTSTAESPRADWLGLEQDCQTTPVGETIQVSGIVDFGLPAVTGLLPLPELIDSKTLPPYIAEGAKHYQTGFDLWIPYGGTALFTLDVPAPAGSVVLTCITAHAVNPDGSPRGL